MPLWPGSCEVTHTQGREVGVDALACGPYVAFAASSQYDVSSPHGDYAARTSSLVPRLLTWTSTP
jgi:hypothetical protein